MTRILSLLMAVVWFGTANHCFVVEALAQTAKVSAHHCCGKPPGRRSDSPSKEHAPSPTHDPSSEKACCKLFVKATQAHSEFFTPVHELLPVLLETHLPVQKLHVGRGSLSAHSALFRGPPSEMRCVLTSLTLAPNAPPASL